jgi:hypothetical protein
MIYLMLGDFTFLDERIDGEHKAIINRVDEVRTFNTIDEAEEFGEEQLANFESYLVPQAYNGIITI